VKDKLRLLKVNLEYFLYIFFYVLRVSLEVYGSQNAATEAVSNRLKEMRDKVTT